MYVRPVRDLPQNWMFPYHDEGAEAVWTGEANPYDPGVFAGDAIRSSLWLGGFLEETVNKAIADLV